MNYAIIGCGLIGKKRLAGLPAGSKLAVACDTKFARAEELVKPPNPAALSVISTKPSLHRKWTL